MYEVNVINQGSFTAIEADGGTRRERGARIGAAVRRLKAAGLVVECISIRYDEAYGFLPRTTARYRVTVAEVATVIPLNADGPTARAAVAAVPPGTLVRYTYTYEGREWSATGMVVAAEPNSESLTVTIRTHEELPQYAIDGTTAHWNGRFCAVIPA